MARQVINSGLSITEGVWDKGNLTDLNIALDRADANFSEVFSETVAVPSSRALTDADNGKTLECTAADLTLTVPISLGAHFGAAVIPNGTTSVASSGGALLNGATSTLTRAAASNAIFGIVARISVADSYVVSGS